MVSTNRSGHAGQFENELLEKICDENGIAYKFSASETLQQNWVVEYTNRSLHKMAICLLDIICQHVSVLKRLTRLVT